MSEHYKQIVINMACDDDLQDVDLQILKEKIEECISINADPEKVKEVHVKVLFLISLIGGSLGTWAGMYAFRHKTKHWYFVVGMPLILLAHVVVGIMIYRRC